jgi:hypothetical protein
LKDRAVLTKIEVIGKALNLLFGVEEVEMTKSRIERGN